MSSPSFIPSGEALTQNDISRLLNLPSFLLPRMAKTETIHKPKKHTHLI